MPLLRFKCLKCGNRFEEFTPVSRIDEAKCPECGSDCERTYEGKCNSYGSSGGGNYGDCSGGNCGACGGCH